MGSTSATLGTMDLTPEPDLHPLYPSPSQIAHSLSPHSGLDPSQKAILVCHCLSRACLFGDFTLLQYIFADRQSQPYVDLSTRDEDGLGLISLTIQGFGSDSEREVEREECVRLLIAQGADVSNADNCEWHSLVEYMQPLKLALAGWTPLHHAAILAPPSLVSYLMTHGCSPFSVTKRQLTPLDIVTAHTLLPGREDIALLLEESMRGEGWTGGRMEQRRRALDEQLKRRDRQKDLYDSVSKILDMPTQWWGERDIETSSMISDSEDEDLDEDSYVGSVFHLGALLMHTRRLLLWISPPCLPGPRRIWTVFSMLSSPTLRFLPGMHNLPIFSISWRALHA